MPVAARWRTLIMSCLRPPSSLVVQLSIRHAEVHGAVPVVLVVHGRDTKMDVPQTAGERDVELLAGTYRCLSKRASPDVEVHVERGFTSAVRREFVGVANLEDDLQLGA